MTYRYLTKKVLNNEAKEYFQFDVEAYLREEFLKQSVGNLNTYDLNYVRKIQCHECQNLNQMGNIKIFPSTIVLLSQKEIFMANKLLFSCNIPAS